MNVSVVVSSVHRCEGEPTNGVREGSLRKPELTSDGDCQ
jgi:hypothetical protein